MSKLRFGKNWILSNSNLIVLTFWVVFYARIIATTINFSLLNLFHLIVVPVTCVIALTTTPNKSRQQRDMGLLFLGGFYSFFGIAVTSSLLNSGGLINALASLIMLGEPFMFLLAIVSIPLSPQSFLKVRNTLYWAAGINFILAAVQKPLIDADLLHAGGFNGTDGCGGVFFVSGAGNYVSATVSTIFALYFFASYRGSLAIKLAVAGAALFHILFSDSKQIVLAYIVAWVLLVFVSIQDIVKTIKLAISLLFASITGYWCIYNVEVFKAYTSWARPELYGPDGLAWYAKFYAVRDILDHYHSPLNLLLGLGPGHTVSRLGAWFVWDYNAILLPLGATRTSIGRDAMDFVSNFWLTSGSSLFSPVFGWAGIWGDLGVLGLAAYLYLCYLVWHFFCFHNNLKIILLSIAVMGAIFTQMEEPGYMLSVAYILGISWHERRLKQQQITPSNN